MSWSLNTPPQLRPEEQEKELLSFKKIEGGVVVALVKDLELGMLLSKLVKLLLKSSSWCSFDEDER